MIRSIRLCKDGCPLYILPLSFALFALLFPDRWQYLLSLILALTLFLASYSLGKRLSSIISATSEPGYFPLGLGATLLLFFAVANFSLSKIVIYCFWVLLGVLGSSELRILRVRLRRSYFWGIPFVLIGFWSCLTPTSFYDALVCHIGLPYQYLALGKMTVISHDLFSSIPPFHQVLGLLFVGMGFDSGIKVFSVIIYFQMIYVLADLVGFLVGETGHEKEKTETSKATDLLVAVMLFLPTAWIQIHIVTSDLLTAFFFSTGIAMLVKGFRELSNATLVGASILISFAAWTKYNVIVFILLLPALWFALSGWKMSRKDLISVAKVYGIILLVFLPFLVRNAFIFGDPLYPALSKYISARHWNEQQSAGLEKDLGSVREFRFADVVMGPFYLSIRPGYFGSADQIGIIYLIALFVYPFGRKPIFVNKILFYALICFLVWLFALHHFRYFFPVFVLVHVMVYVALWQLSKWSIKVVSILLIICMLSNLYLLAPIYVNVFPLIRLGQKQTEYLRESLNYFSLTERLSMLSGNAPGVVLLGETRICYFRTPLIFASPYDKHPFLSLVSQCRSPEELFLRMKERQIGYIVYNMAEFRRLSEKYGVWKLEEPKRRILQDFIRRFTSMSQEGKDIFVFELKTVR